MSNVLTSALRAAACSLLVATPVLAGDFYVSSSTGDDANDGLSPATAWATITFALSSVPLASATGFHTIHVAPGTYSQATGETFPLEVEEPTTSGAAEIEIVSEGGSAATTIVGTGFRTIRIHSRRDIFTNVFYRTRIRRVEGFTILPGTYGVAVVAGGGNLSPVLRDLVVEGASASGIRLESVGDSSVGTSGDVVDAQVVDCEVRASGGHGIEMIAFGDLLIFTSCTATLTDAFVHDNAGDGLYVDTEDSSATATLQGCRIVDNGGRGVTLLNVGLNDGGPAVDAANSLVAGNGAGGVLLQNFAGTLFGPFLDLERCTVAGNQGQGIFGANSASEIDVDTCIVFGNVVDLAGSFNARTVEYSDVGTGDAGGSATNLSVDPAFVDAANGDYRLQDGSPCIDAGNPALADPDGTVADMGSFPFDQDATTSYCTGKTSSLGCVPFITWSGFASVSAPQPFSLAARDVLPSEAGILVYGLAAGNLSFHGGKLCVKAPLERTLPVKLAKGTGTPPCTGVVSRNFNNRIQSGADVRLTAGQTVFAQWIVRDPADPAGFGDGLTDAARFVIAP